MTAATGRKLTKDDIRAVLAQLDTAVPADLSDVSLRGALLSILFNVDCFRGIDLLEARIEDAAVPERVLVILQALEALHHVALWVYKHCPSDGGGKANFSSTLASKVLDQAEDAAVLRSLLILAIGDWAEAKELADSTIEISLAPSIDLDLEAANRLLTKSQSGSESVPVKFPSAFRDLGRKLHRSKTGKVIIPTTEFGRLVTHIEETVITWQFHTDWDLGGYTFGQLRHFWATLIAMTFVHLDLERKNAQLKPRIRVRKHGAWVSEITRRSGLPMSVVNALLSDLTYDPSLYVPDDSLQKGRKVPPVLAQPFFPVGNDELAVASASVMFTNIEEVFWDLLSVIRTKTFSQVANLKESFWKGKLIPLFEGLGMSCYGPFAVEHNGQVTNLDLLVVDHKDRFVLACELKWLKTHDQLRDCSSNDKELADGCKKAHLCVEWLRSNPALLTERISTPIDWSRYSFEGIVLSRNSLGASRVQHAIIPVLNKYLLETVLLPPHQKGLRALWLVAKSKGYLPKRGLHYQVADLKSSSGSLRIIGKGINMLPGTSWNPLSDISFN